MESNFEKDLIFWNFLKIGNYNLIYAWYYSSINITVVFNSKQ